MFQLLDIWLFDISFFLVRAAVRLCRNDVMRRQKELPKIKICLFKATTVASGGGEEETDRQTVVVLCKIMQ